MGHPGPAGLFLPGSSTLHRLPAHTKLVALLGFVLVVVLTPGSAPLAFLGYAALLAAVVVVARIPPRTMATRMAIELPFLAFALLMPFTASGPRTTVAGVSLSTAGLAAAGTLLAKATLSVAAAVTLSATTPAPDLLSGMARLRTPALLVEIAGFMLRYASVITEQLHRMAVARAARCFQATNLRAWPALGAGAGALFIRSYERGERVHLAMLARGYDGRIPTGPQAPVSATAWAVALSLPVAALAVLVSVLLVGG